MPTDLELLAEVKAGATPREIALRYGFNENSVRGRVWRARQGWSEPQTIAEQRTRLGAPLHIDADSVMVTGDWQIPTTDCDMVALMLAVAKRYMKKPRRLIIAGDFLNADAFTGYDPIYDEIGFTDEIDAARALMHTLLIVFEIIYWSWGNHERRATKKTRGALTAQHVAALVTHSPRVIVSHWSHMTVNSGGELYRITHPRNYSVNKLVTADVLAQKFQTHIISHHEHHLGKGIDRYGRYVLVNNGGMFARDAMGYAVLDDSKSPAMTPGFTLLRDGVADVFGASPYTNWDAWLPEKKARVG